jgi:hypothetical protein
VPSDLGVAAAASFFLSIAVRSADSLCANGRHTEPKCLPDEVQSLYAGADCHSCFYMLREEQLAGARPLSPE